MLRRRLLFPAAICVLPFALIACGKKSPSDPRTETPLVRAAQVELAEFAPQSFTGVVAARIQSDLGFRVSGKVLERFVDTGQAIKHGQPLMRIDPIDLKLAAEAQQQAVIAARARSKQAAEDEARYRDLVGAGAVSASAYDQTKAAADSASAQLRAAEAQTEVARNAAQYADLVADADGVIMETLAEPGQVVSAGQVVVRLARAGHREAIIQLPETLRPEVGSSAEATLFGGDNIAVPAKLRQLSNAADPVTRTFEARYVLDDKLANAPLGSTVTIQIQRAPSSTHDSLRIPIGALLDQGNGPGVWLIEGQPARVTWRPVTIQNLDDSRARVAGSLVIGDQIVALGAHLLHEGELVRLAEQRAPAVGDAP